MYNPRLDLNITHNVTIQKRDVDILLRGLQAKLKMSELTTTELTWLTTTKKCKSEELNITLNEEELDDLKIIFSSAYTLLYCLNEIN